MTVGIRGLGIDMKMKRRAFIQKLATILAVTPVAKVVAEPVKFKTDYRMLPTNFGLAQAKPEGASITYDIKVPPSLQFNPARVFT